MVDIGRWVSLGIILLIIIISIIVELAAPSSFGITTAISFVPAAIIAGVANFVWWLPLVEVLSAIVIWIGLYFLVVKVFKFNKSNKKQMDYVDEMLLVETTLISPTSNVGGKNEYGQIKIDDKLYLVLPVDKETTIDANQTIKIVKVDGNISYVRKVN